MSSEQPNKKSLRKSNQKALPRKQQLQDDIVASDIASKLQMGVSELEIFADLLEQQIPMDEIQSAFSKAGMDENGFNSLVTSYEQAMLQQQQQQAMPDYAMPQMQYGGSAFFPLNISQANRMKGVDYVPPTGTYLPEDLGNRGNVLGAFATLAEGAADLFSGKDRDGDGLMDGAFRDSQAKKRAFKRGKASQFDYTDSEGEPIGGGEYSDEELFKASKDETYIPRTEKDLLKEYSRFGMDEQGKLQAFLTDRPFDKRDYTKQKDSPYYRNKLEDLYSGMKPAGEFDFNPFIKTLEEQQKKKEEDSKLKRGGDLPKYQSLGEFLDEDNDGIPDYIDGDINIDADSVETPTMLPEVVINANSQLPKVDPLPMKELPSIVDLPETLDYIDELELDPQIGSINKKRKSGSRMKRFLDSPGVEKFGKVANFGVAAAGVANEMFQNKRALDAERELDLTTADDLYGTYEEREGDRGMYDVNTGLAQPDNLDIGYAMHGMEVPMMNTGMPRLDMNQEIDLDMETITKLIAAGADIEIL